MSETSISVSTVLLVDDDELSLRLYTDLLESKGVQVTSTVRADEALRWMGRQHFDLLITDLRVQQPNDGLLLCSAFRRLQPDSPTLLVTGSTDLTDSFGQFQKEIGALHLKGDSPLDLLQKLSSVTGSYSRKFETQSLVAILRSRRDAIADFWLKRVESDPVISRVDLSRRDRVNNLYPVLDSMFLYMEQPSEQTRLQIRTAAELHGRTRRLQGYSLTSFILELGHLRSAIDDQIRQQVLRVEAGLLWEQSAHLNVAMANNIIGTIAGWEAPQLVPLGGSSD